MYPVKWESTEEKMREWRFAEKLLSANGKCLANGTKLRRKDYPNDLKHSFIVIDNRILAVQIKGHHLGYGLDAHVKIAEDKAGNLIALKVIHRDSIGSSSENESFIASDLGIAGQRVSRDSASTKYPKKNYIAYQYLGSPLIDYLEENKEISLDRRYELSIKISLALYKIHSGSQSKSKKSYFHGDIHWGNLLIDDKDEIHFIDFGRADEARCSNRSDIVSLLLLFYTPLDNRTCYTENWIFSNWVGEYTFWYGMPKFNHDNDEYQLKNQTIYIYDNKKDKNDLGALTIIRYLLLDPYGAQKEGFIKLEDIGLNPIFPKKRCLRQSDIGYENISLFENSVLEDASLNGYTVSQDSKSEMLSNLLINPVSFNQADKVPTALEIAETLTLCRLHLENSQQIFETLTQDKKLELIKLLNAKASEILSLYEKLNALSLSENQIQSAKNHLLSHLIPSCQKKNQKEMNQLNMSTDISIKVKQYIDNIFIDTKLESTPHKENTSVYHTKSNSIQEISAPSKSTEVKNPTSIKNQQLPTINDFSKGSPTSNDAVQLSSNKNILKAMHAVIDKGENEKFRTGAVGRTVLSTIGSFFMSSAHKKYQVLNNLYVSYKNKPNIIILISFIDALRQQRGLTLINFSENNVTTSEKMFINSLEISVYTEINKTLKAKGIKPLSEKNLCHESSYRSLCTKK